ncbi:MAG: hypothetical protein A3F70_11100 [Acidobacteria bacterium RIFCSPLOWO2_12_FULL_67_14]|nr:MAG: hypothetical protein A3H29_16920 [Acidobacteria bacterium RIFCSPLOWO2_02_FULL_67_21]OFW39088.1 MAG: hypothetical protein A3F70_11100 [Acidobacteria bacterium RIFCSPLOWO2_12_FULL_67_14]
MAFLDAYIDFLRSTTGRIGRVAVGLALIAYGATHPSLVGLVLMMIGIVPAVTGLAGVCLLEEVVKGREARLLRRRPREGRA